MEDTELILIAGAGYKDMSTSILIIIILINNVNIAIPDFNIVIIASITIIPSLSLASP